MKRTTDADMPIGKLRRVPDFLPPPTELARAKETVKVTITLSRPSVDYFKRAAKKNHVKYQRMIRELLDRYAAHYQ